MRKTVSSPEVKKPARAALTGGVAVGNQVFLSGQMAYDPEVDGIPADMDAAVRTVAGTARSMGIETEGVN